MRTIETPTLKAEVVAIGSELLLGDVVDTNSAWLGMRLAEIGVDCDFQTKVGDVHEDMVMALRSALQRSDVVIVCGGLGPTQDDITRAAIAEVMEAKMDLVPAVAKRIEDIFQAVGRVMPSINLRQAEVPRGATAIMDPLPGTAPGLICPVGPKKIYALPGVPSEMKVIFDQAVAADIASLRSLPAVKLTRQWKVWGMTEAAVAERLGPMASDLEQAGNPVLSYLASGIEGIKVRLTARASNEPEAASIIEPYELIVIETLGSVIFASGDETMESSVLDLARSKGLKLALAESLTGGMIASRICDVPGASDVFLGGVVAYSADLKDSILGVKAPAVSRSAACEMASGVRRLTGADIAISTTGVAGPGPDSDGNPAGLVYIGLDLTGFGGEVTAVELRFKGDRDFVRQLSVISALHLLRSEILKASASD